MSTQRVAVLGGGNMGRALVGGLLRAGMRPEHISVGESDAAARARLSKEFGVPASAENREAVAAASLIVVAVKPADVARALRRLESVLRERRPVVLSIAAGVRIDTLERLCGRGVPVVRAMPNRPALVGAGATGLYAPPHTESVHCDAAARVMQSVGEIVWLRSEDELDVVTALSGSGPAYFFLLAEWMMQGAVELGLDPVSARRLALATLHGAGELARAGDGDLARLRAEVTSKGGTTEAALERLNGADLRAVVCAALQAATRRSRELATIAAAAS